MTVRGVFTNATERRSLERGEVLFAEGDHGAEMFGVVAGLIELHHGTEFVEALGPGQTFGEMAIIDQSPRSLTAIASEPSEVAVINRRTFLFLVHETPEFALQVMHTLSDRIRRHGFSD
jgi:CRP/FNR family cyclic AMP-dependent transcriptional regulator